MNSGSGSEVTWRDLYDAQRETTGELLAINRRLLRVEIGGAALTALCVWALTGNAIPAAPPAVLAIGRALSAYFGH